MNKITYNKHDWTSKEYITEALLDNIENGINNATTTVNGLIDEVNNKANSSHTHNEYSTQKIVVMSKTAYASITPDSNTLYFLY